MHFSEFRYKYLHQKDYVERFLSRNYRPLASNAYAFAKERHAGQKRLDGSDYIVHLIEVAYYHIINDLDDDETIAACFLHDGPEDKKMTQEEVELEFRDVIAHRTLIVTKEKNATKEELEVLFDKIFEEIETIFLKVTDRASNVKRSMIGFFSREKLLKYCDETEMIISRLEGFIAIIEDEQLGNHYYKLYHQYARRLRVLRGFIKSFIQAAEEHLKLMDENDVLKKENDVLRKEIQLLKNH